MKTLLVLFLSLLALPLKAELRGAARVGEFEGSAHDLVGTIELDARYRNWSFAPAYEVIRGGYDLHAVHIDVRRLFPTERHTFWIGAGPTFVSATGSSERTWNLDAGMEWRTKSGWEPFVAARYYRFDLPVFRDALTANGAVVSAGISRRFN
jgi:hypothetical protein